LTRARQAKKSIKSQAMAEQPRSNDEAPPGVQYVQYHFVKYGMI
jgi:hypothetical protein